MAELSDTTDNEPILREIDLTDGARALSIMELVNGVARVICIIGVPLSVFVILSEIHVHHPLQNRLPWWIVLTALGILGAVLAFSFAIKTMRPVVGVAALLLAAGPALWALYVYSASFGPWAENWAEHVPVLFVLAILALPLLLATWRVSRLPPEIRALSRRAPPIRGFAQLWRETFEVWPGVKPDKFALLLSHLFSGVSSLILWVGVFIMVPIAFFVLLMMRLLVATKGPVDVLAPPLIVVAACILLVFLQNAFRSLARWCSRAALAQTIEKDTRPPTLFLRSFQDDQVSLPEHGFPARFYRKIMNLGVGKRRLDHLLIERFYRYGPAVALGVPGEKNLPFGAARVYPTHAEWKTTVQKIAARSNHVVLVADATPGIEWEIGTFLENPLAAKTLFLCATKSRDLRESPEMCRHLAKLNVDPGGVPIIGLFQDRENRTTLLRCSCPKASAVYITALQTFFRLRC